MGALPHTVRVGIFVVFAAGLCFLGEFGVAVSGALHDSGHSGGVVVYGGEEQSRSDVGEF